MGTLLSFLIVIGFCTFGLGVVAVVMIAMGFGGAPGAILYEIGKKKGSLPLKVSGLVVTGLGQAYVVGIYAVLLVSALRYVPSIWPNLALWPLWIVSYFHSNAAPAYGLKEKSDTAQFHTLLEVVLCTQVIFFTMVFAPRFLQFAYGWVPFFGANFK